MSKKLVNPDELTSTPVKVKTRKKISKLAIDTDMLVNDFMEVVIDIIDKKVNTKEDLIDLKNKINR